MNRTALYALLIAVIVPVIIFFIVNALPVVKVPKPVFYDTVLTRIENGKEYNDTVWQRMRHIEFINQFGDTVDWNDMKGKVVVANFFFTHCPTICPPLARNMKLLQETIKKNQKVGDRQADFVQFLSISVDPDRDSVPELKKWADRFQVDPANWWLVTGNKDSIYDLSINYMKLLAQDPEGVDTAFVHTDIFVLLDRDQVIRARREGGNIRFYHGLDSTDLQKLAKDIIFLNLEKDPKKKSFLRQNLPVFLTALGAAILGIIVFMTVIRRKHVKS